jgi:hypothetical protein
MATTDLDAVMGERYDSIGVGGKCFTWAGRPDRAEKAE